MSDLLELQTMSLSTSEGDARAISCSSCWYLSCSYINDIFH